MQERPSIRSRHDTRDIWLMHAESSIDAILGSCLEPIMPKRMVPFGSIERMFREGHGRDELAASSTNIIHFPLESHGMVRAPSSLPDFCQASNRSHVPHMRGAQSSMRWYGSITPPRFLHRQLGSALVNLRLISACRFSRSRSNQALLLSETRRPSGSRMAKVIDDACLSSRGGRGMESSDAGCRVCGSNHPQSAGTLAHSGNA